MKTKIKNYLRAGYSGLYLISPEEKRIEGELKTLAAEMKYSLYAWNAANGLLDTGTGGVIASNDPVETLDAIAGLKEKSLVLLRDFHLLLDDPHPVLIRKLKDVLQIARTQAKAVILLGCRLNLPPELEREITILDVPLPGKNELEPVLDGILESAKLKSLKDVQRDAVLDAARGLTTVEAENAFALSVIERKTVEPSIVAREKAQALRKNGLLEIVDNQESLDSIGGLNGLKNWLLCRRNAFGRKAREYGLPACKGLLIVGIAGTGKSLTAKATASVFGLPLLRLDAGKLFGGLVGQSEGNLRSAIGTAEAMSPCVVWIDEIEKGLAGSRSSGSTDGGTSARVFGSLISWMQERKAPVFMVATANDVSQLPPELLRKGRFDEMFFVDLPNPTEREAIWKIQIRKYRRNPDGFDVPQLARITEGCTGSEIEQAFIDALHQAFAEDKEPTDITLAKALTELAPLSSLMREQIAALRTWSKGRARPATPSEPSNGSTRKLAA
ncbi:MAG: AAA family ATPase [Verrucomicrobia bacterium]|nr:AAA family ATPase [Verrucomicrobiota bacterium]